MNRLSCSLVGTCGGCPWGALPLPEQHAQKRARLRALLVSGGFPAELADAAELRGDFVEGFRDRLDFALRRHDGVTTLGLWPLGGGDALVPLTTCPLATPELARWFGDFAAAPPPLERASVRLRTAPDGRRGVWLDAANLELKALLDEGAWLRAALAAGVRVELGQRRKPVVADADGSLGLQKHAALEAWFDTGTDAEPLPLRTPVGGFTQPGRAGNRLLVAAVREALGNVRRVLEIGAGAGNFTLPLAHAGAHVRAAEPELLARLGLVAGATALGLTSLIEVVPVDLDAAAPLTPALFDGVDALLADPPRSGLGKLPARLAALPALPPVFVHVSCHAETLGVDLAALAAAGYTPVRFLGVDQFPHTPELEWVVRLERR